MARVVGGARRTRRGGPRRRLRHGDDRRRVRGRASDARLRHRDYRRDGGTARAARVREGDASAGGPRRRAGPDGAVSHRAAGAVERRSALGSGIRWAGRRFGSGRSRSAKSSIHQRPQHARRERARVSRRPGLGRADPARRAAQPDHPVSRLAVDPGRGRRVADRRHALHRRARVAVHLCGRVRAAADALHDRVRRVDRSVARVPRESVPGKPLQAAVRRRARRTAGPHHPSRRRNEGMCAV